MNDKVIFLDGGKISSFDVSTSRSWMFVRALRNEPLIRRNGISRMSKSFSWMLWFFRICCSIFPSRPPENLVLYPARIPFCWPF